MGRNNRKTQEQFETEMKVLHPDIQIIGTYVNNKTPIELKCLKDNHEWSAKPDNLLSAKGCPVCANRIVVKGINDIATTTPKLINLLANIEDGYKYTSGSGKKILWKCPSCGEITNPIAIKNVAKRGFSCRKCGDKLSTPNKMMYNLLNQIGIEFSSEKRFDWCKFIINNTSYYGIYDFYFVINNSEYIVEMDGGLGHGHTDTPTRSKELSILIDKEKDKLAIKNNIHVIRIDCVEFEFDKIKEEILKSDLSLMFNLSTINWDEIFINCIKSRVYMTCDLWNIGIKDTKQIANIMKISQSAVVKDLKKGYRIDICDYTPQLSKELSSGKQKENVRLTLGKSVVCLTTGEIFDTMTDAHNKYGKYINIVACCKKVRYSAGCLNDGTKLRWMYYDEYVTYNKDEIEEFLNMKLLNNKNMKVICLNDSKIFDSITIASELYKVNRSHISDCCKGKRIHCGKFCDGTPIKWMYYDEYLKSNSNNESNCEKSVAFSM